MRVHFIYTHLYALTYNISSKCVCQFLRPIRYIIDLGDAGDNSRCVCRYEIKCSEKY